MLERSISYDAAIQLIRRRLQGDRSPDRAREVLIMEALASGEVPMEPVFVPFAAKRYGYDSLVAWLDRNYPAASAPKTETPRWAREPVIAKMKEFYPPDGIRPKGVSIAALTKRINRQPEFQGNPVIEDTVRLADFEIKAALKK